MSSLKYSAPWRRKDSRLVGITAAMPEGTGLKLFHHLYPDRFFDVGIAEEHAVTFAAGLAAGGLKPYVMCLFVIPSESLRPDDSRCLSAEPERDVLY